MKLKELLERITELHFDSQITIRHQGKEYDVTNIVVYNKSDSILRHAFLEIEEKS